MDNIIWLIIMIPVSLLFTGIGIYAWKRKKPMWFWSGSTVKESEISDIAAYNKVVLCQVLEQLKCPFFCHRLCNNLNNFIACYYVIHVLLIVFFLVFIWRLIFTMGMDSHRIVEAFYIAEYD